MTYFKSSVRVLLASSTAIAVGIAPLSAAPARLPDRPAIAFDLADRNAVAPNRSGPLQDGWIIDAGVCDDDDSEVSTSEPPEEQPPEPPEPPEPTEPTDPPGSGGLGGSDLVMDFAPFIYVNHDPTTSQATPLITVDCHDNDRTEPFLPDTVEAIIADLEEANVECAHLDRGFRIDCLAARYEKIALSLAITGDQRIVKSALNKAARKLRRIVRQNADPTVPDTRFALRTPSGATKPISSRPLTAIKPASQQQANAAAAIVIDELNTKLLRSSENSARRQEYFAEIVMAVDSNKVLLRS